MAAGALDKKVLRQTMRTRLYTVAGIPGTHPFHPENRRTKPPDHTASTKPLYVKERLFVTTEDQASFGCLQSEGQMRYGVAIPAGRGTEEADDLAKLIALAFAPSQSLQSVPPGLDLALYKTETLQGSQDANDDRWWVVPVSVWWRTFTSNSNP